MSFCCLYLIDLFGRIKDIVPVPSLIEIQSKSFNEFAQLDYLPSERELVGLQKSFRDVVLLAFAAGTYHDAEIVNDFMGLCERTEEEWSRPDWTCRVFNSIHGNAANWILKGSKEFGCSEDRYIPEMVGFYLGHEVPNYFVRELEDSHKKSVVPGSEAKKRTRVK